VGSAADTIFAPATVAGSSAIAVIRVSGTEAGRAAVAFAGPLPPPRVARRCRFRRPTGEKLDDGLLLWFPAPRSATGEDVAEFHLHGSRAVLAAMAEELRGLGLRLAEPGEFTRRAFLNGKLDLTQAEAIADLVAAETEAQRHQAMRQLDGELGALYRDWTGRLSRALAHLEAVIDFPDEDLPSTVEAEIAAATAGLLAEIERHLADGRHGERLREGISVAILGPPNAGKSSLLNRIARREAAITSPIPGTTRDIVEVAIDLAGYPVLFADTAGLRDSDDLIEQEGLRRALARAEQAEIRLFVYDARFPADAEGAAQWPGPDTFLIANKTDLLPSPAAPACPLPGERKRVRPGAALVEGAYPVSALTGEGIEALLVALAARIARTYHSEAPLLTRARHRHALEDAALALRRSLAAPLPELRAEDLRLALRSLGQITGAVDVEDLLDQIFRDFCIGK
jgi:tRNA modification GTPase